MNRIALLLLLVCSWHLNTAEKTREEILKEEAENVFERSLRIANQFYSLEDGEDLKEITDTILQSSDTRESTKLSILSSGRRFFLFIYPSDGFQVKGTLSYVPDAKENPLLIFLRGGNRILGLIHPAADLVTIRNYTVIATSYRGGVSEGTDEFGGSEVNDVHNLVEYFPTLQEKLKNQIAPKKTFILGGSRGGLEMFLALNRSPTLQYQVNKAASLSGMLSLRECMIYREDMKRMFVEDFGLVPEENEDEWLNHRDPIANVSNLRKDLPILILQGTDDLRVSLNEGYHMVKRLEERGNPITYLEIPGGNHCLLNQPNRVDIIADWFEDPLGILFEGCSCQIDND